MAAISGRIIMPTRERPNELETARTAFDLVQDFSLSIDVGAHRGRWISLLTERFDIVHAFEPEPWLFDKLSSLYRGNSNIILHNSAVMEFNGLGEMSPGQKLKGAFVMPKDNGSIVVERLDKFDFSNCGLLKIDVEGAELLVLKGGKRLIRDTGPVVVVECKSRTSARYGWAPKDLHSWFEERNYHLSLVAFPNFVYARQ